jgi:hypothetical protein
MSACVLAYRWRFAIGQETKSASMLPMNQRTHTPPVSVAKSASLEGDTLAEL